MILTDVFSGNVCKAERGKNPHRTRREFLFSWTRVFNIYLRVIVKTPILLNYPSGNMPRCDGWTFDHSYQEIAKFLKPSDHKERHTGRGHGSILRDRFTDLRVQGRTVMTQGKRNRKKTMIHFSRVKKRSRRKGKPYRSYLLHTREHSKKHDAIHRTRTRFPKRRVRTHLKEHVEVQSLLGS